MIDANWQPYLDKLKHLEAAVKLVAYHTQQAAQHTREASFHASMTAEHVNKYLSDKMLW